MTILYILLFIVCLSTLIMVHEAGHLATAKIFKVYCFEYAIGFGPKLFSFKRKKGETAFSLRAIPFGGFVSMYGEDAIVPEGVGPIDPSRSLNAIKKWKKCIILAAGVVMNFVLAIVIFFVYEAAFPAHVAHIGHVTVKKNSIAYEAGLRTNDYVYSPYLAYGDTYYVFYDDNGALTYQDESISSVFIGYNYSNITLKDQSLYSNAVAFNRVVVTGTLPEDYTVIEFEDAIAGDYSGDEVVNNFLGGYIRAKGMKKVNNSDYRVRLAITENYLDDESLALILDIHVSKEQYNEFKLVPIGTYISGAGDISTVTTKKGKKYNVMTITDSHYSTFYADVKNGNVLTQKQHGVLPTKLGFRFWVLDEEDIHGRGNPITINEMELSSKGKLPKNIGVSMLLESYHQSGDVAFKNTFKDFGRSATLIFRGLGELFSKDGFKNVGGIIAIGVSTTQVLQQNGFGLFLFYWALISVNLGIVNLLPFPGLDGWQLLVTVIEGTTRKTIPPKIKNYVSAVGIILLFVLMILIIIKDLIMVL